MGEVSEVTDPIKRVEELFLEMKDTSELMVDLAYSSLLYNNKDLAAEVEHLGDRVDELSGELKKLAIEEVAERSKDATMMVIRMADFVIDIRRQGNRHRRLPAVTPVDRDVCPPGNRIHQQARVSHRQLYSRQYLVDIRDRLDGAIPCFVAVLDNADAV